jgi:hypothetical protein
MIAKDLIVLTADKDTEFAIRGLLARHLAIDIRQIQYDIFVHPERDPGCQRRSHTLLRPSANRYQHAVVIFDREGSGRDDQSRLELERDVEASLASAGWQDRSSVIVINPELENWVWSDSPHVRTVLGWTDPTTDLSAWLQTHNFLLLPNGKPHRPKEAMLATLRAMRKAPSAALFKQLASKVSFNRCTDEAFIKLLSTLRRWFPPTQPTH